MYSLKIRPEQVKQLYEIREESRLEGNVLPIALQIRIAIEDYLKKK